MDDKRYEYYFYRARLIVTSRLHVAAPAVAMGIPCILASDNFDNRFSWIDKLLPLYTPENFDKIEWNPLPVEYEQQKADIKNALKRVILGEGDRIEALAEVSAFYEMRDRIEYNSAYKRALEKYGSLSDEVKYAIWGTVTSKSNQLKHCIDEMYPKWTFIGIFDKFARGNFEGYNIQSSELIAGEDDVIYFVMSKAIYQEAKEKLSSGKYVLVDVTREHFEDNFM